MRELFIFVTIILLSASAHADQPMDMENELSASEIKDLARVISAAKSDYSSLAIEILLAPPGYKFRCHVYYEKPDKYALYVLDGTDMTPIFIIAQRNALLYDPSKDNLILFRNVGVNFVIAMDKEQLQVICGYLHRTKKSKVEFADILKVDLVSILNNVTANLKIDRMEGDKYAFSGETREGGKLLALVDQSAAVPFTRMAIYQKNETAPLLVLNRIEGNVEVEDSTFQFPEKDMIDHRLNIKEIGIEELGFVDHLSLIARILFIRSALRFPEMRSDLTPLGLDNLDWSEIEKRDEKVSPVLRKLFQAKEERNR